ncbi:MAG: OmpH family outer membrane protein [Candidatus Melainabacteria bacterium]|nr:OmpH family outer membrane protein [Candidatus Melainabacteria bacterium]
MLKSRFLLVLALCILSCLSCVAASAEEKSVLIGVVDSKEILEKYSRAKAVLAEIAKEEAALSKKFQEKRTQLEAARKANKTETEIQLLTEQIRTELEPSAKKLELDSAAKSKEVETNVKTAIEKIRKKNKIDLVLLKDAVLSGGADITAEVLKELETQKP